ncbi:glutathione S-transferase family protein [Paracoccaceae bacterium]|nr:glutathione S-transferase family protein [Paracoccaceae bacterium]
MNKYVVIGRPRAGSLIAEFLLSAANVEYDFKNISVDEAQQEDFKRMSPFSKIPVLVCPDGQTIFETVAIVIHFVEKFPQLAAQSSTSERNSLWQYLALIQTAVYAGYHRQFYSHRYAPKNVAEEVGILAAQDREVAYSYINANLNPYVLGKNKSAVDYYLYMVTRWDPNIDQLLSNKGNLESFVALMKKDEAVRKVLLSHNL